MDPEILEEMADSKAWQGKCKLSLEQASSDARIKGHVIDR